MHSITKEISVQEIRAALTSVTLAEARKAWAEMVYEPENWGAFDDSGSYPRLSDCLNKLIDPSLDRGFPDWVADAERTACIMAEVYSLVDQKSFDDVRVRLLRECDEVEAEEAN